MMVHWGKLTNDLELLEHGMKTAYGVYYQTWLNEETAYFFDTPEAWRYDNPRNYRAQQYQRPRAVWELLLEIKNPFGVLTDVGELPNKNLPTGNLPTTMTLQQNYPNPFNATTTIHYELHRAGIVRLELFDLNGRWVKRLIAEQQSEGRYAVVWDGTDDLGQPLASGVVFCRLELATSFGKIFVQNNKLCLLK